MAKHSDNSASIEKGSLRELAPEAFEKEQEVVKVREGLKKIESVHDLSELPLTLIQDVFHNANLIEEKGTVEALRFSSDSKRRLLDSLIKGKNLISTVPLKCEECPRNEKRIQDIMGDRKRKDELIQRLNFTPEQNRILEESVGTLYPKR